MYEFLLKFCSKNVSTWLTGAWYLMLILLIIYMMYSPAGELRYLNY